MRKSFLVLVVLLVAVFALMLIPAGAPQAQPGTITEVPTITPIWTFTPLPTATLPLTPQPTSAAPGCDPVFSIDIGNSIVVRGGVNIRATPSINGPWVTQLTDNWVFTVLDGPVCADNYNWWAISDGGDIRGWVAERNAVIDFVIDTGMVEPVCAEPLDLIVGEDITLSYNVRIRDEPARDGRVLTVAPVDTVATVLEAEPVCADGYVWRKVRVAVVDFVYDGWMAEGSALDYSEFFVELDRPEACLPPLGFAVGDLGRVYYRDRTPKNLRIAPNRNADVLYALVRNVPLEIIGGPVCSGGMNWWQVRVRASSPVDGWLAEGTRGNYYIRRFAEDNRIPGR